MLNCNKVERERGCIKAISIMQKLGCALIMQGEWWIQGLFQVLLILSLLLSGEWLCSVVVFSDQRISGLCGTSASIVCFFFFSFFLFESTCVWTSYQMLSSFSFLPGPPYFAGLTSIQCSLTAFHFFLCPPHFISFIRRLSICLSTRLSILLFLIHFVDERDISRWSMYFAEENV